MKNLCLLVGPPGSGKSTLANEFLEDGFIIINQDDQGKDGHWKHFCDALQAGKNIVVDRMNFNKIQRDRYLLLAKEAEYATEIVVFHETYHTCFKRCVERKNHPTIKDQKSASSALHTFFSKYERVENTEADIVSRNYPPVIKKPALIIDLDGTLCNIDDRKKYVHPEPYGKKDWKAFFSNIKNDKVNKWCNEIIDKFSFGYKIVLCTGRPDDYRKDTERWLLTKLIPYDELFMRQRNDFRPDHVIKETILDFEILPRYDVLFAVDDRNSIIDLWRKRGIVALQCSKEF